MWETYSSTYMLVSLLSQCKSFSNIPVVANTQSTSGCRWRSQARAESVLHYLQRTWLGFRGAAKIAFSVIMMIEMNKSFNLQQSGIFLSLACEVCPRQFQMT